MRDEEQSAERYLHTARKIRRATNPAEVASAVIAGVTQDLPDSVEEWRRRAIARRAVETTLRCLQISIMQRAIASPEMASDLRIEMRKHIARVLASVAKVADCTQIAELAVSAVTPESAAESMVKAAREVRSKDAKQPVAVCCLAGKMLVSSPALEFARTRGVEEDMLARLLDETHDHRRERTC